MSVFLSKSAALGVASIIAIGTFSALADDAKPNQSCAFSDRVSGWEYVDKQTSIIEVGVGRYKVTFVGDCRESRDAFSAKLETHPGICVSPGDTITFGQRHGIRDICVIQTIEKLPPRGETPASAPAPY